MVIATEPHLDTPAATGRVYESAASAVAVSDGDCHLTVAELDRWSNRLARLLMKLGAEPGTRVLIAIGAPIEEAVADRALSKIGAIGVPARRPGHGARLGITTTAQCDETQAAVEWLVLDDQSTLRHYLTGSDAPLTAADYPPTRRPAC